MNEYKSPELSELTNIAEEFYTKAKAFLATRNTPGDLAKLEYEDFCTACQQMCVGDSEGCPLPQLVPLCEVCGEPIGDYDDEVMCESCDAVGCGSCGSNTRQSCRCDAMYESWKDSQLD